MYSTRLLIGAPYKCTPNSHLISNLSNFQESGVVCSVLTWYQNIVWYNLQYIETYVSFTHLSITYSLWGQEDTIL